MYSDILFILLYSFVGDIRAPCFPSRMISLSTQTIQKLLLHPAYKIFTISTSQQIPYMYLQFARALTSNNISFCCVTEPATQHSGNNCFPDSQSQDEHP